MNCQELYTSTSTIEWAMAELIKTPESMDKIRQELAREIKQGMPKESQRLHPPTPILLPHRALSSCKVMNYTIPKDAQVIVNVLAILRDPKIWEDPVEFKPERFLKSTLDYKGNDFEFLLFGAGWRSAPALAANQVPLVLASLVHFFYWSLPN